MASNASGGSEPEEKIDFNASDEDSDFNKEDGYVRQEFCKKTGNVIEAEAGDMDDAGFFEGVDAGSGEQFMAVRPYEGAIAEPDEHNEPNSSAPDTHYDLEYVYGYRCEDSR